MKDEKDKEKADDLNADINSVVAGEVEGFVVQKGRELGMSGEGEALTQLIRITEAAHTRTSVLDRIKSFEAINAARHAPERGRRQVTAQPAVAPQHQQAAAAPTPARQQAAATPTPARRQATPPPRTAPAQTTAARPAGLPKAAVLTGTCCACSDGPVPLYRPCPNPKFFEATNWQGILYCAACAKMLEPANLLVNLKDKVICRICGGQHREFELANVLPGVSRDVLDAVKKARSPKQPSLDELYPPPTSLEEKLRTWGLLVRMHHCGTYLTVGDECDATYCPGCRTQPSVNVLALPSKEHSYKRRGLVMAVRAVESQADFAKLKSDHSDAWRSLRLDELLPTFRGLGRARAAQLVNEHLAEWPVSAREVLLSLVPEKSA